MYIIDIVFYLLSFISLIALLYIIYSGFQIITGAWDEEKNKKAKNTITYIAVGIILIWLAIPIVKFIVGAIDASAFSGWKKGYVWSIIPSAHAEVYSETSSDTFREYQNKLRIAIQDLESELKINKNVSTSNIQNIKSLVQSAYDRLPDFGESGTQNDTMKRAVDRDLELALKNPSSTSQVGAAISSVASFISSAKIEAIQWGISATPREGNAPVTVSFEASGIRDPSWATPDQMSYIWWMRENGWGRRELWRGKSLVYTFSEEWTYTVFLDVVSWSRNSKKRIDVLPLTASTIINVKPRLWQIVLLVNGVNVSNLESLKINPTIGKMGIIFDATASRATGWNIINTKWDFWNGNSISHDGSPIVERQIFANSWDYNISLRLKTNNGQDFTKNLRLIVRNPSAVIQANSLVGNVWKEMFFSSLSYFTNTANVEYSWQIQDDNNKKIINNLPGNSLKHTFDKVWTYIITLNARSPNGDIDTDSKQITIESQAPVANIENPVPLSSESPNILVFDGSKSFDSDTMSRKWLTYSWYLDGEKITLDNPSLDGAKWQLEFSAVWSHTIKLTIANSYGKVTTTEKKFDVRSVLSGKLLITPRVAPIGTTIHLIAQSENADFFEWNMGDGSPTILGNRRMIQHKYAKTWIYDITLTITNGKTSESNSIKRRIHITDTWSPFAMIGITNPSSTVYHDADACDGNWATIVNRSDITTFDATKSINVDGWNTNLSYTWNYFWKVKTTPTLTEKLTEIWCFPIKLTVRSTTTGVTHTSTEYIAIKNLPPEITSLSTSIDPAKKDSQKILVRVTANGAIDPDGVITSYIWYYTTESDKEPQNIQITQTPTITFVLPNITEKYYFGVILEDNDGVRTNSIEEWSEQVPLIIDNKNGNIYMPLITLSLPKNSALVGEAIKISAGAKTIIGTDITKSAEYAWDFDGDGRYDEKTTNPTVNYTYKNSGTYSVKVRVTYNGVSNVKYWTITIKNPLKASAVGYSLSDGSVYLMNTSEGQYDTATWIIGGESIESRNSVRISADQIKTISGSTIAVLRSTLGTTDISTYTIRKEDLLAIDTRANINYQTSPVAIDNTIHIKWSSDQLNISMLGNTAASYTIDTNTNIDSDLDGISDNDIDNKNHPSYNDGSIFTIADFTETKTRKRTIRLSTVSDGIKESKDITIIFDFIPEVATVSGEGDIINFWEWINDFDKNKLNELSQIIRTAESADRIILMQKYNILIENWADSFSKAKSLIDLQEAVNTTTLSEEKKIAITTLIDNLLVGDASSIDEITIATKLIQDLIPTASPNRDSILQKLGEIASHPWNLEKNRPLWKEILELIKDDTTIEDTYKIHIKNQLLIIIKWWQSSIYEDEENKETESGSILSFIGWFVKVFVYILWAIFWVILIGYIFYLVSRKKQDIWFQDFVIDSVFHSKKPEVNSGIKTPDISSLMVNSNTTSTTPPSIPIVDPLSTYVPPVQKNEVTTWSNNTIEQDIHTEIKPEQSSEGSIPSWLQIDHKDDAQDTIPNNTLKIDNWTPTPDILEQKNESFINPTNESSISLPTVTTDLWSWLQVDATEWWWDISPSGTNDIIHSDDAPISTDSSSSWDLPDWLVDSIKTDPIEVTDTPAIIPEISPKTKTQKKQQKTTDTEVTQQNTKKQSSSDIPDWLK